MKLKGWYIDGFDMFRDHDVTNLSGGLTVFAGPNEAGKSTLLAFLRGMLFGFPDGRSRQLRYPPLRGGRHGGRIFLHGADGDYTVERYTGGRQTTNITLPDGRPAADVDLVQLLGGADDSLFRSVFAFSLTELQSFESLGAEGVRDRIFSAGIAGAGRSARDSSQQLRTRASTLLKTRGLAVINDLVRELDDLRDSIGSAQRAAIEYSERQDHEEYCCAEIDRLTEESQALQATHDRALLLIELWPLADERETVTSALAALDAPAAFPEDAEARLGAVLQRTAHAQATLDELSESRASAHELRTGVTLDPALDAVSDDVEHLHEKLALHRSLLQQLPSVRNTVFQAKDTLDEKLATLGPDWNETRVAAFDGSIPQQEEVRDWHQRLDRDAAGIERTRSELDAAVTHRADARQSRDRLATALSEDLPEAETLEAHATALRRLRASIADHAVADTTAAANDQLARDRDRARRLLEAELTSPQPRWLHWSVAVYSAGAIGAGGWLIATADQATGIVGVAAGLALAGLAAVLHRRGIKRLTISTQQVENLEAVTSEHANAAEECEQWHQRSEALYERIEADCAVLALTPPPSAEAIEARHDELEQQKAERQQWNAVQSRLAEADALLEDASGGVDRMTARLADTERLAADQSADWDTWKTAREIPESLSPQGVLDYFEAVRLSRGVLQSLKNARAEGQQLSERIGAWEEHARAALAAAGMHAGLSDDELIERLIALRVRCRDDQSARSDVIALDRTVAQLDAKIATATDELDQGQIERDRLFDEVGAADESSFRARLAAFRQRSELDVRRRELDARLTARVGRGEDADALHTELATGGVEGWRQAAVTATAALEELRRQRDEAVGSHRDAQRSRLELESSADIARLELEAESLRTELDAAAQQWRTITLARALIEDTLAEFERTRQPAVLAEASRTFAYVTDGRYERIVQEENARDIAVLDARSGRRAIDALSRGTAEQLYLCIRLALAEEFASRSEPLPLVMDDVFVNFDPARARAIAEIVAEFAQSHQVLAFTCHPSTRDLMLRVDPNAGVIELEPAEPLAVSEPKSIRALLHAAEADPDNEADRAGVEVGSDPEVDRQAPGLQGDLLDDQIARPASGE